MTTKQHERVTTGFGSECKFYFYIFLFYFILLDDIRDTKEGLGTCGWILVAFSYVICALTFPFSLCVTVKVRKINIKKINTIKKNVII